MQLQLLCSICLEGHGVVPLGRSVQAPTSSRRVGGQDRRSVVIVTGDVIRLIRRPSFETSGFDSTDVRSAV